MKTQTDPIGRREFLKTATRVGAAGGVLSQAIAEIAWDIAKGDKEGRRKLYEKLNMPIDPTVKPER